jgi:hypothetical protein
MLDDLCVYKPFSYEFPARVLRRAGSGAPEPAVAVDGYGLCVSANGTLVTVTRDVVDARLRGDGAVLFRVRGTVHLFQEGFLSPVVQYNAPEQFVATTADHRLVPYAFDQLCRVATGSLLNLPGPQGAVRHETPVRVIRRSIQGEPPTVYVEWYALAADPDQDEVAVERFVLGAGAHRTECALFVCRRMTLATVGGSTPRAEYAVVFDKLTPAATGFPAVRFAFDELCKVTGYKPGPLEVLPGDAKPVCRFDPLIDGYPPPVV